jgi:proteic killer suppression protein
MRAVNCLADTLALPGRFHRLRENSAGQWSADLKHPLRLIFEPANDPMPELSDGSPDPSKVNVVRILEVIDTHG